MVIYVTLVQTKLEIVNPVKSFLLNRLRLQKVALRIFK